MAQNIFKDENGREVKVPKVTKKLIRANQKFDVLYNLGTMELNAGRHSTAFDCFKAALEIGESKECLLNMATCYKVLENEGKAKQILYKLTQDYPEFPLAYNNYGLIRYDDGEFEEAIGLYNKAIALWPEYADAHWNHALALLIQRFDSGVPNPLAYAEFEWRFKKSNAVSLADSQSPRWQGEDLRGKKLLFMCEQGFGDMFMFMRYLELLPMDSVYVHFPKEVKAFLGGYQYVEFSNIPHDYHIPIMSLPNIMGEYFPSQPYLDFSSSAWNFGGGKNIGIVWKGNRDHANDKNRSMHFRDFFPLLGLGKIWSLQYGVQVNKYAKDIHELEIKTFIDTANYIAGLDLVVTVDTSVAHLAGAMGKPVLVVMPSRGLDWRWGSKLDTTPWYPTMRLCRKREDMVKMAKEML
jgi:tetratricopeptide (TPR) repeat protein